MKLPIGDISPCQIIWNYTLDPMHLDPYLGAVTVRGADTIHMVHEEGYGEAPVDAVSGGTVFGLDIPMARNTMLQLAESIAYKGMGSLDATGKILTLKNWCGCDMYANSRDLVIAPICNNVADPDPASWIHLYKCHPYRDFELTWDAESQRIHMVKFMIFPNQDSNWCGEYGTEGMASGSTPITGVC